MDSSSSIISLQPRPKPTPTNAYMINTVTSQVVSGADPLLVTTLESAEIILAMMKTEGVFPTNASEPVLDEEGYNWPNLRYGSDGRKAYVISWDEPNPKGDGRVYFAVLAGEVDFQLICFPKGFGDWSKKYSSGEVDRVGLRPSGTGSATGGDTSQSRPAKVVNE